MTTNVNRRIRARPDSASRHDHSADAALHAMADLGRPVPATASGVPEGFRVGRTLPVRVELIRQLRRRRTQLALGFMVALPVILLIAFSIGSGDSTATVPAAPSSIWPSPARPTSRWCRCSSRPVSC